MYVVRLNDLNIRIKGSNVIIEDIFHDTTEKEVRKMVQYLVNEGFLAPDGEINVLIQTKNPKHLEP